MLRFSVLFMGCLVFAGLAAVAAGPLRAAATPPLPPTPGPRSSVTATPQPTARPSLAATATTVVAAATSIPATVGVPAATLVAPPVEALDPPELRAVWVDAFHDGFKTAQQVDNLVAWARRANVNALFVQVRRRGDAYYLKSFEPRSEDPDLTPGFDELQYLLADSGATIVVTIDADGQHMPEELAVMIGPIVSGDADYVNGSRLLGEFERESIIRHIGVHFFSRLVTILTTRRITDPSSGYRAARALMLLPWVAPTVLSALAWLWLLNPQFSAISWLLVQLHVIPSNLDFLGT